MIRGEAAFSPDGTRAPQRAALPIPAGSMPEGPPQHVLRAFGASAGSPERLEGGQGRAWRSENIVLKPVTNPAEASWTATILEQLQVPGVRIARPVRSSDGRWVVAGWSAQRFVSGSSAHRHEEILQAAGALHDALAPVPEPRFLRLRTDLYSWADRLSWGDIDDDDGRTGTGHGARLFAALTDGRRSIDVRSQVVHGDMYGNVLFAGTAPPAVVDITPYWRPPGWAAGVVVVDALAWGGAPIEFLTVGDHWPQWRQLLRRALLFRLAVSLAHPMTRPSDLVTMLSTADRIAPHLD